MALKKITIDLIASLLKIKSTDLETAIKAADEVDVAIDDKLAVYTEAEITTRDRNKYNDGKIAGEEMKIKAIKEKFGVDVPGTDADKVIEAITKKAVKDAGINPDAAVVEKDKTIEQLRGKLAEKDTEVSKLLTATKQAKADSTLLALLPANRDDRFTNEQYLTLLKTEYELTEHEGKPAVKNLKTGEIVKNDKDLTPKEPAAVISGLFESSKWLKAEGQQARPGAGGKDSKPEPGTKFAKLSELRKHAEENNISIQGQEFRELLNKAKVENKEFLID